MPDFSLIVPTRRRPEQLQRALQSVEATAARPDAVEVVLVVDADDPASLRVPAGRLRLRHVVGPPGQAMGALNMAGYAASTGRYLMLLNDDVVARTAGWDDKVRACFAAFPDGILLVHVNDLVFQKALCTFPIVSRRVCALAGGICPRAYARYRIDDHLEDLFNLLGVLGARRSLYLPGVVFEHLNYATNPAGLRQYFSEPETLARDAALFAELFPRRKQIALSLMALLRRAASAATLERWRARLDTVKDSASLRVPERLCVLGNAALTSPARVRYALSHLGRLTAAAAHGLNWASGCYREKGLLGIAWAVFRRLARSARRQREAAVANSPD